MNRKHTVIASLAALTAAAGFLLAGPLNPPAGPVASSYKTLTEVEPRTALSAANTPGNSNAVFVITAPGSYYLTGNLQVPAGENGIVVGTFPVTIDLNGFSIMGASGALSGVTANGIYLYNVTVKNGAVTGFATSGIDLSSVWGAHVQNIMTSTNGVGIKLFEGLAEGCDAMSNTHGFVAVIGSSTFLHCTASGSAVNGFDSAGNSVFEGCTASANTSIGFNIGNNSTIRSCVAVSNGTQGIVCGSYCTVLGNQVRYSGPGYAGIWAQSGDSDIDGNDLTGNGYGVYASGTGSLIVRNRCNGNTTDFYVLPGNRVGQIITPGTNAATINGSSGGGLGTTDPYANLIY
jgi:hypothetical protein